MEQEIKEQVISEEETNKIKESDFFQILEKLLKLNEETYIKQEQILNNITNYNISMYKIIDGILRKESKDYLVFYNNSCWQNILNSIYSLEEESRTNMMMAFTQRYYEILKTIGKDVTNEELISEIIKIITTASELSGEQHLNTIDSFIFIIIGLNRVLDFDWEDIEYNFKRYIKKIKASK